MAHAHALAFPAHAREPLDGTRITAFAGTILLNGALVLLLLVPLSQRLPAIDSAPDDPVLLMLQPPRPKIPPPLPVPVPVIQRAAVANPQPVRAPQPVAHTELPVVDPQPGDIAIEPADVAIDSTPTLDPAPPAGAQLQALRSPPPAYPGEALRAGLTGTVELEILVGIDGRPLEARVVRSSGHRALDQAARRAVLSKWTFVPAMRDGQPVQALGRVPIEFRLD